MAEPVPIPDAVREQMAMEKLAAQYRALFGCPPGPGQPDTRSEAQIDVWRDLEIAGYVHSTVFRPDRAGALCPLRAAFADGRRSIFLYIETNVKFVPTVVQQQPPK